jgi:2'-5' RNA ligase
MGEVLQKEIEGKPPIPVRLATIGDYYPDAPVIYWSVEDNNRLKELYYRIYGRLEMPIPRKDYIPHVTVAREISDSRLLQVKDEIVTQLPTESFRIETLDLIGLFPNQQWVTVRKFFLGDI